jgi:hypothetical protein
MMQAAREAVAENVEDYPSHTTACFDGTWQKRGPTFLNGIVSATSVNRGKILGTGTMSKSWFGCHTNPTCQHYQEQVVWEQDLLNIWPKVNGQRH